MTVKTVYILHKNGADSHYIGLKRLIEDQGGRLVYREFSVFTKVYKALLKLDFTLLKRQFLNIGFYITLYFSKDKRVVLGIAPYESRLTGLLRRLKNHDVYYHTSWTYWDQTFQPRKIKKPEVAEVWRTFLEDTVQHIFAVTEQTKRQLLENYNLSTDSVSVVAHTVHPNFLKRYDTKRAPNRFVYFGRMISQKGIKEVLEYFRVSPELQITMIGTGPLKEFVRQASEKYDNIHYLSYMEDTAALARELSTHQFLIQNSFKTDKWEELFGMAIIEGMSQGLIPIASAHSGPKEIIHPDFGYVYEEGELKEKLNAIVASTPPLKIMSDKARIAAQEYSETHIASRWKSILDL